MVRRDYSPEVPITSAIAFEQARDSNLLCSVLSALGDTPRHARRNYPTSHRRLDGADGSLSCGSDRRRSPPDPFRSARSRQQVLRFLSRHASLSRHSTPQPTSRSPNLNAFTERWVRSIRSECLSKLILLAERLLRRAVKQFYRALSPRTPASSQMQSLALPFHCCSLTIKTSKSHPLSQTPWRVCSSSINALHEYFERTGCTRGRQGFYSALAGIDAAAEAADSPFRSMRSEVRVLLLMTGLAQKPMLSIHASVP